MAWQVPIVVPHDKPTWFYHLQRVLSVLLDEFVAMVPVDENQVHRLRVNREIKRLRSAMELGDFLL